MAVKTFYLKNALAGSSAHMSLQDEGTPPGNATTGTGWTVAKIGATNYARMDSQTERASGSFAATAEPSGAPDNTLGDCWRTETNITGTFDAGNWTFTFPVVAVGSGGTQDGRIRMRLWRSANEDGSSAVEITGATQVSSTVTNLAVGTPQDCTITFNPGQLILDHEYLFVQVAWEITGSGGNNACDVLFRVGSGANIATANFTSGNQNITGVGEIASAEAFDSPTITRGAVSVTGTGEIATAEAFGQPTVTRGAVTISVAGDIASAEAFGTPTVTRGPVSVTDVGGIASAEGFTNATVKLNVTDAGGIASAEAFDSPIVRRSISNVGDIASAETFDNATITRGPVSITGVGGIASAEAFGTTTIRVNITDAGGIGSVEAFGTTEVDRTITGVGNIASAEAFDTPKFFIDVVNVGDIASAEAFGTPNVPPPTINLRPPEIGSAETFGTPEFTGGLQFPTLPWSELQDSKYFGIMPADNTLVNEIEGGYEITRPRFSGSLRRTFSSGFTHVTEEVREDMEEFYNARNGGAGIFKWKHPITGTTLFVRFTKPIDIKYVGIGDLKRWNITFEIRVAGI